MRTTRRQQKAAEHRADREAKRKRERARLNKIKVAKAKAKGKKAGKES